MNKIKTHIKGFDEAIGGGIFENQIVMISGEPGSFKSSIAFSILYQNGVKSGKKGFYMIMEQPRVHFLRQMDLMGFSATDSINVFDFSIIRKNLGKLKAKTIWLEVLKMYLRPLKQRDFNILVIDSFSALLPIIKFENKRDELFKLFLWLKDMEIMVLLINETTHNERLGFLPGIDPDLDFLVDGKFSLFSRFEEGEIRNYIICEKLRGVKHSKKAYGLSLKKGVFEIE